MMVFVLPVPPTLNHMYANVPGRGRVKSRRYTAWRSLAVALILAQAKGLQRVGGKIDIVIELPSRIPGDIDNRIKPILDALVTSGRIDDDRHVQSIAITKTGYGPDVSVWVSSTQTVPTDGAPADPGKGQAPQSPSPQQERAA